MNFLIKLLNPSTVKLGSLNLALKSADGMRVNKPAELETLTTLAFWRSKGNRASHTLNVPK